MQNRCWCLKASKSQRMFQTKRANNSTKVWFDTSINRYDVICKMQFTNEWLKYSISLWVSTPEHIESCEKPAEFLRQSIYEFLR